MTRAEFFRACAAGLAAVGLASRAAAQERGALRLFVIRYRAGPAWREGLPMERQALGPHAHYYADLLADGRLVAGGRFVESETGMAILRLRTRAEAEAILAADPAIVSGVFAGELSEWRPRFQTSDPLPPPSP
ncbi:MAG: YciI family protein [Hyphomonadaceae bacterium]